MDNKISDLPKNKTSQWLKELCLLDDEFMTKCFEDNAECIELVFHIILEKDDLQVKEVHVQHTIQNLYGKSVRLDIYAADSAGRKYNIEIQREDKGANVKRARYNSSIIDANILKSGGKAEDLPDTYVIFITENDVLGENLGLYCIDRYIGKNGRQFGDGSHIIYVNGAYRGENPLGRLMHDFSCAEPSKMYYRELAEMTGYFKNSEEGEYSMSGVLERIREDGHLEGKREGQLECMQNIILRMLETNELKPDDIARYTGATLEEVENCAKEKAGK